MKIIFLTCLSLFFLVPFVSAEESNPIQEIPVAESSDPVVPPDDPIPTDPASEISSDPYIPTDDAVTVGNESDEQFHADVLKHLEQIEAYNQQSVSHLWWINTVWFPGIIIFLLLFYIFTRFVR